MSLLYECMSVTGYDVNSWPEAYGIVVRPVTNLAGPLSISIK